MALLSSSHLAWASVALAGERFVQCLLSTPSTCILFWPQLLPLMAWYRLLAVVPLLWLWFPSFLAGRKSCRNWGASGFSHQAVLEEAKCHLLPLHQPSNPGVLLPASHASHFLFLSQAASAVTLKACLSVRRCHLFL